MEDISNDPCLVDLYEGDSCNLLTLFETDLEDLIRNSEDWKEIIYSHIDRVLDSPRSLKIDSFDEDFGWLNSEPLSLDKELKNKLLILDFFTYCCINCEHALPLIQQVEEEFKENSELVVIGVHSPKFPNERDLDSVKNAVLRNKIKHPVINDPENHLWNKLGVYCWPTVLITSPSHHVLFSLVGEVQIEKLSYLFHQTLNYFKMKNTLLNTKHLQLTLLEECKETESLLFPSGISACDKSIIVSDTGHNRLLLLSFDGKIQHIIGSGVAGHKDGSYLKASFHRPQGTAWWKSNFIFVADTGNNCIRKIDLNAKEVSTVFKRKNTTVESDQNFSSPWDVCIGPEFGSDKNELNVLYIAVAGSHQIWAMSLQEASLKSSEHESVECSPFAGKGVEECRNNSYKMQAGFAQPSGVSYSESNPGFLFIADSESSTIRSLSLLKGQVKTVVGGGLDPKNLFQYGDKDGSGYDVKLQHPLGICVVDEAKIYIADSYNHKIKLINDKKQCFTLAGSGVKGSKTSASLLECEFDEPSAICYSSDEKLLLIADTNNHSIKIIDPEAKILKVMSLVFPDISCVDAPVVKSVIHQQTNSNIRKINLKFGGTINCTFKLNQPGLSLTGGVIQPWNISLKGTCNWNVECRSNSLFHSTRQPSLILKCTDGSKADPLSEIIISANLTLCDDINNICFPKKFTAKLEIEFSEEGHEFYEDVFVFN